MSGFSLLPRLGHHVPQSVDRRMRCVDPAKHNARIASEVPCRKSFSTVTAMSSSITVWQRAVVWVKDTCKSFQRYILPANGTLEFMLNNLDISSDEEFEAVFVLLDYGVMSTRSGVIESGHGVNVKEKNNISRLASNKCSWVYKTGVLALFTFGLFGRGLARPLNDSIPMVNNGMNPDGSDDYRIKLRFFNQDWNEYDHEICDLSANATCQRDVGFDVDTYHDKGSHKVVARAFHTDGWGSLSLHDCVFYTKEGTEIESAIKGKFKDRCMTEIDPFHGEKSFVVRLVPDATHLWSLSSDTFVFLDMNFTVDARGHYQAKIDILSDGNIKKTFIQSVIANSNGTERQYTKLNTPANASLEMTLQILDQLNAFRMLESCSVRVREYGIADNANATLLGKSCVVDIPSDRKMSFDYDIKLGVYHGAIIQLYPKISMLVLPTHSESSDHRVPANPTIIPFNPDQAYEKDSLTSAEIIGISAGVGVGLFLVSSIIVCLRKRKCNLESRRFMREVMQFKSELFSKNLLGINEDEEDVFREELIRQLANNPFRVDKCKKDEKIRKIIDDVCTGRESTGKELRGMLDLLTSRESGLISNNDRNCFRAMLDGKKSNEIEHCYRKLFELAVEKMGKVIRAGRLTRKVSLSDLSSKWILNHEVGVFKNDLYVDSWLRRIAEDIRSTQCDSLESQPLLEKDGFFALKDTIRCVLDYRQERHGGGSLHDDVHYYVIKDELKKIALISPRTANDMSGAERFYPIDNAEDMLVDDLLNGKVSLFKQVFIYTFFLSDAEYHSESVYIEAHFLTPLNLCRDVKALHTFSYPQAERNVVSQALSIDLPSRIEDESSVKNRNRLFWLARFDGLDFFDLVLDGGKIHSNAELMSRRSRVINGDDPYLVALEELQECGRLVQISEGEKRSLNPDIIDFESLDALRDVDEPVYRYFREAENTPHYLTRSYLQKVLSDDCEPLSDTSLVNDDRYKLGVRCPLTNDQLFSLKAASPDGFMKTSILKNEQGDAVHLPHYPTASTVEIQYMFYPGVQSMCHPIQGERYTGGTFKAYIPASVLGGKVLFMLKSLFDNKRPFTILGGKTVWNSAIPHKRGLSEGDDNGCPDDEYLAGAMTEFLKIVKEPNKPNYLEDLVFLNCNSRPHYRRRVDQKIRDMNPEIVASQFTEIDAAGSSAQTVESVIPAAEHVSAMVHLPLHESRSVPSALELMTIRGGSDSRDCEAETML